MTFLITIVVYLVFYIGGALANASFNLATWDNREVLFGIATGVIIFASGMNVVLGKSFDGE